MTASKELIERGERLRAYVDAAKGVPANWDGCSIWPAQWVADETGREFDWPVFESEEDGRAYVDTMGGLVNVWAQVARQAKLKLLHGVVPSVGDVGIIETGRGQSGGIFTFGGGICVRSQDGVGAIGVVGRTFPVRRDDGTWDRRPVVIKAWALG